MENKVEDNKVFLNQTVHMDNRKSLNLTGVCKMISANNETVLLKVGNSNLKIDGKDLKIAKLDTNDGVVNILGFINSLKYCNTLSKTGFIKRIFK